MSMKTYWLSSVAAILLASCGGGGSSSTPSPSLSSNLPSSAFDDETVVVTVTARNFGVEATTYTATSNSLSIQQGDADNQFVITDSASVPGNHTITLQEKNKALVARVINEVLNKENYALIDELLSDNLVEHDPNQEKRADAKESFKATVQAFKSAFPDGQTIIESQVAEGDIVVTRWRITGTHKGIFMGIEATNKKIEMTGMFYDRVLDGQLHETWSNWDLFGLMRQLQ